MRAASDAACMGVRAGSAPRPDGSSACTGSARPTLFVRVLSVALAALIPGGVVLIPQKVEAQSTQVDSPTVVPGGSVLVPEGLTTGDRFRVLFLTSGKRKADSSDVGVYNGFLLFPVYFRGGWLPTAAISG